MKQFLIVLGLTVLVGAGFLAARAIAGTDGSIAAATAERWYKVPYFPEDQSHCAAELLPSICCAEAYVRVSDVDNACQLSSAQIVRVVRDPLGVSSCCDCGHEFCVQINSNTPVVNEVPSGACRLVVQNCYGSCSSCMNDL